MKILAVEFSSEHREVAVLDDQAVPVVLAQICEQGGRRALDLVERALAAAQIEREEIGAIVVGLGPGSYTGIRGSIALAQGWELGLNVKLLGISSVECMAEGLADLGEPMTAHLIIDAQRNEFHFAKYDITPGACLEVEALRLVPEEHVQRLCEAGEQVLGPEAAARFPGAKNLFPQATMLGRMALERSHYVTGDKLEPIYLRQTDYKKAPPRRIIF
jgi:tRNA threonylcarbamoyladenosine biosynthesis protein TsaB